MPRRRRIKGTLLAAGLFVASTPAAAQSFGGSPTTPAGIKASTPEICRTDIVNVQRDFTYQLHICKSGQCRSPSDYKFSGTGTLTAFGDNGYVLTAAHNLYPKDGAQPQCGPTAIERRPTKRRCPGARNKLGGNGTLHDGIVVLTRSNERLRQAQPVLLFAVEEAFSYGDGPDMSLLRVIDAAEVEKRIGATSDTARTEFWQSYGIKREAYDRDRRRHVRHARSSAGPAVTRPLESARNQFNPVTYVTVAYNEDLHARAGGRLANLRSILDDRRHHIAMCAIAQSRVGIEQLTIEGYKVTVEQSTIPGMSGSALLRINRRAKLELVGTFRGLTDAGQLGSGEHHVFSHRPIWPVLALALPSGSIREKPDLHELSDLIGNGGFSALHTAMWMVHPDDHETFLGAGTRFCQDPDELCFRLSEEMESVLAQEFLGGDRKATRRRLRRELVDPLQAAQLPYLAAVVDDRATELVYESDTFARADESTTRQAASARDQLYRAAGAETRAGMTPIGRQTLAYSLYNYGRLSRIDAGAENSPYRPSEHALALAMSADDLGDPSYRARIRGMITPALVAGDDDPFALLAAARLATFEGDMLTAQRLAATAIRAGATVGDQDVVSIGLLQPAVRGLTLEAAETLAAGETEVQRAIDLAPYIEQGLIN